MSVALLTVRGLSKSYRVGYGRTAVALHRVDLTIQPGEGIVLAGGNGAGKTSLLSIAAGLRHPTSGTATAGADLGYVPDHPTLPASLTPAEFLDTCARLHDMPGERAHELLDRLGLSDADRPMHALSAGARQRVVLAQALVHQPSLLLLDEPLRHLDPGGIETVLRLLGDHVGRGGGLMVATHRLSEWVGVCSRLLELQAGVVTDLGALDEVLGTLPARIFFTLPPSAAVPDYGRRIEAVEPVRGRLVGAGLRTPLLDAITEARGRVVRVEPAVESLGTQGDIEATLA